MTQLSAGIRVLIADDNRIVRKALRLQLEQARGIRVIGEVSNGADAVAIAIAERADVVLMDIQMPGMSGIEATRELTGRSTIEHPIAVIVMTSFAIDGYVIEALDAGAVGYLLKSYDSDKLLAAVHAASHGQALVSSHVTASILNEFKRRGPAVPVEDLANRLTAAERRVVSALSTGVTSNEGIAELLHVSVHTVRSHLRSATRKVGLDDRTQLALWGLRNHLDDDTA